MIGLGMQGLWDHFRALLGLSVNKLRKKTKPQGLVSHRCVTVTESLGVRADLKEGWHRAALQAAKAGEAGTAGQETTRP